MNSPEKKKRKPSWRSKNIRSELEKAESRDQYEQNSPTCGMDGTYVSPDCWHKAITGFTSEHRIRYKSFESK